MKKLGVISAFFLIFTLMSGCNKEESNHGPEVESAEIVEIENEVPKPEEVLVEEDEEVITEDDEVEVEEEPVVETPKVNHIADPSQVAKLTAGSKYESVKQSFEETNTKIVEYKQGHSSSNPEGNMGIIVDTEFQGKRMKVFIDFNSSDGLESKISEMIFFNEAEAIDYFDKLLAISENMYGKSTGIIQHEGDDFSKHAYWENNTNIAVAIGKSGSEIIVSAFE